MLTKGILDVSPISFFIVSILQKIKTIKMTLHGYVILEKLFCLELTSGVRSICRILYQSMKESFEAYKEFTFCFMIKSIFLWLRP